MRWCICAKCYRLHLQTYLHAETYANVADVSADVSPHILAKAAWRHVLKSDSMTRTVLQVLDGGENLLDVVDKLTAEAAAQEAALQAQMAAEAASISRIAQLEEEQLHIEEQYSTVQVFYMTYIPLCLHSVLPLLSVTAFCYLYMA